MQYVYYFEDYWGNILYVGKTSNIYRRMREHFLKGHLPTECYQNVKSIYYAETGMSKYDNEIIETLLIDNLKPLYNTEKVFIERSNLASYKLPDLSWSPIYIDYMYPDLVSKHLRPYIFFNDSYPSKEKQILLIEYNINILKKHRGLVCYIFPGLVHSTNDPLFEDMILIYEKVKKNLNFNNYDLDEPLNACNAKYNYVSFYLSDPPNASFNKMLEYGLFEKSPNETDQYYSHPLVFSIKQFL